MMKNYAFLIILLSLFTLKVCAQSPLEVFSEENYEGSSQQYEIQTLHIDLGAFDNNIKSFKLQQGYMATFASNSDGTGYSRVFRADDSDLEIEVMPPYLNGTISFIRTLPLHDFVKRKGWAGWNQDEINATNISWYYDWSAGGTPTSTIEYVPIKQHQNWPSWDEINTKEGATHLLGYNEPSHDDQANMTVQECIDGWPNHMQSGLRLGSIATDDPFNPFLQQFMDQAEALNYRVDFIPLHCYWNKPVSSWSRELDLIYENYKRPIWITEWNIGANWTTPSRFPNDNPNEITDENAAFHLEEIIAVLDVLESKEYIERYSIYNWVENARKMIVDVNAEFKETNPNWENYVWLQNAPVIATSNDGSGDYKVLTPAGEYYSNLESKKAYNPTMEYIPTWTPLTESLSYELSNDLQSITLSWEGINDDLVNNYIVERKLEGETEFISFFETSDYSVLSVNDVVHAYAEYRIKVIGKDDAESAYSEILVFQQSEIAEAPSDLAGEAVAASIINLSWSTVDNALGYNLKRATTMDGSYETIAPFITESSFQDTGLNADTNYYYKISSVNTGGESEDSSPITVTTKALEVPNKVSNILLASGDAQVKLGWDVMYDAKFYVKRSTSENGTYDTIATVDTYGYTDITVVNGTTYYYKISAFNDMGEGENSEILVAIPKLGQHTFYNFNENNGTSPHDQWGYYTGILNSAVAWEPGLQGSSIYLDGTASSFMDIEDGVMENLTDFTISAWLKLETVQNWVRVFDFGIDTDTYMFLSPRSASTGNFRFAFKNGGDEEAIDTNISPIIGNWVHVAVTLEGSTAVMYIDGVEAGRNEAMTINPSMLGKTTQNYIGKSQWPDPNLDGRIDEFKIYNYALTPSEIAELTEITISSDNFSIQAFGETCPNKDNGKIEIVGNADLTYNATVNGTSYPFSSNTLTLTDLPIGTYDVCITVSETNMEQCYVIDIIENEILFGKFTTSKNKTSVQVTSGTAPYNVAINGVLQFQTSETEFEVNASVNDYVEITSAKDCEGSLSNGNMLLNAIAFPNPTSGHFQIAILSDSEDINLEIYDIMSRLVSSSTYSIMDGKVSVNIENEPSGIYFIKVQSDMVKTLRVIKK